MKHKQIDLTLQAMTKCFQYYCNKYSTINGKNITYGMLAVTSTTHIYRYIQA